MCHWAERHADLITAADDCSKVQPKTGQASPPLRWRRSAGTMQPSNHGLTSGLPRVKAGLFDGGRGPASPALIEEVIDPVQSKKADEDQIDGHCEAHDPRRNQQKHSRDQGNDRQKVVSTGDVHQKLIADLDDSAGRRVRRPRVGSAQADAMAPET